MRRALIIWSLFLGLAAQVQSQDFRQVDSSTYRLYLNQEWKELIRIGKQAGAVGFDYYYLNMRIAYAYFSLGKYRNAIPYYKKALVNAGRDETAAEFLYYSYKYGGRDKDAIVLQGKFSDNPELMPGKPDTSVFLSAGVHYGYLTSASDDLENAIVAGTNSSISGYQKATHYAHFAQAQLSHRIGHHLVLHHGGMFLYKNELSYVISDLRTYLSPEQPVSQYEYSLGAEITPSEGWTIMPGIHFLNTSIPLYDEGSYGFGMGLNRTEAGEIILNNRAELIQAEKRFTYFDLGISYVHHNFNEISTHQPGVHFSVFPLGNLDLYLSGDGYYQSLQTPAGQDEIAVFRILLGAKVFKNLWLEFSGTEGTIYNFYDTRSRVAYNTAEKIQRSLEANAILPFYKANLQVFLGYRNRLMESWFFPEENLLEPFNRQSYTNHLILAGIKWKRF